MRRLRSLAAVATVLLVVAFTGCGGGDDSNGNTVVVSGASSLQDAFTAYADAAGYDAKQSFAGSDDLAAQIRQGAKPDVYAAANTSLPDQLHADGLVGKPVVFATNTLVVAVPSGSDLKSIDDLAKPGTAIAIGDPSVPVGSYTREVLGKLPAAERQAILDNVRSEEPDVAGIVGKLTQGAVDAGFVYITDVVATDGRLTAVRIPAGLQPDVQYAAAVVTGADHPDEARSFIDGLLQGEGAKALQEAGFKPPPPDA
jgi:molybdate transport system substrate-binding protein